jgi:hypothetical protein
MDKNEKISRFIIRLGAITFLLLGGYELALLLNLNSFTSRSLPLILKAFGGLWIVCGVILWVFMPVKLVNTVLMFTTFNIGYLLLELYVYTNLHYNFKNQFFIVNNPYTTYHEVRGYSYSRPVRLVSIINRQVEFNVVFKPNTQGYSSKRDYTYKKRDTGIYRIIVLGDSFTDGCFLEKSWPDALDNYLNEKGQNVEVYSFSYSGNGIVNWENIFRHEILPNYEFDCIVFANFSDDLSRKFNIQIVDDKYLVGNFDTVPVGKYEFEQKYLHRMLNLTNTSSYKHELVDDNKIAERIDEITSGSSLISVEGKWKKPEPYIINFLINDVLAPIRERKNQPAPAITWNDVEAKYGLSHLNKLKWMADTCNILNKRVIFSSIPLKQIALNYKQGMNTPHQQECKLICQKFNMEYFDGYDIFLPFTPKVRKDYWFIYDGHWNSKGSDLFAMSISSLFINKK